MGKQLLNHRRLPQRCTPHPLQQICNLLPLGSQGGAASTQLSHQLIQQCCGEVHLR